MTRACCCATRSTTVMPARHDTYSQLLDRYHTDPDLRTAFDETTAGLGVRVLAADRTTGLVLTAESDSPMAVSDTSPWLRIRGAADRMVYGVALGGVAAWCYPNARAVRQPGTRRVTAVDVDRLIANTPPPSKLATSASMTASEIPGTSTATIASKLPKRHPDSSNEIAPCACATRCS